MALSTGSPAGEFCGRAYPSSAAEIEGRAARASRGREGVVHGHGLEKGGKQQDGETLITGLSTARLRVPHLTRSGTVPHSAACRHQIRLAWG